MRPRIGARRGGYKIAIVSDWYLPRIGGLELHLRDLARELSRRGHEAEIITCTPGEREADKRYANIVVHRLPVPLMPRLETIRSRRALAVLEARLEAGGYDFVHCHSALSPLSVGAAYVARRLGIPSLLTEHSVLRGAGLALLAALHKIWGWASWPTLLSAVSHYVGEDLRRISGRDDVLVLPNGIDLERWRAGGPPPLPSARPLRVTTVMRFTKRKRPHQIIRAIPAIQARLPLGMRPLFTLIGDGPERARVEREVRRLGVGDQVELTGFQPRHQIRELLRQSSLFILPTSKEALSIATLEARASGLPVVAMNHGGVGDLIVHRQEGFLAADEEEFVGYIAKVLLDAPLRARMSAATLESLDRFGWQRVIAEHLSAFEAAHARHHGARPPSVAVAEANAPLATERAARPAAAPRAAPPSAAQG